MTCLHSNNTLDMFAEMRSASLLGKLTSRKATAVTARSVIRMATINGAKAMGMEKEIGSIEVGKKADLTTGAILNKCANPQQCWADSPTHRLPLLPQWPWTTSRPSRSST